MLLVPLYASKHNQYKKTEQVNINNTNPATQNKGRTQDTKVKLGIGYHIKTNNTIRHNKTV